MSKEADEVVHSLVPGIHIYEEKEDRNIMPGDFMLCGVSTDWEDPFTNITLGDPRTYWVEKGYAKLRKETKKYWEEDGIEMCKLCLEKI